MNIHSWFNAIWGTHQRNVKLLSRQKQLIVAPIILPLVLMFLTAVVMGSTGDQWTVGLINESSSPASHSLIKSLKESHSNISPYFNIIEPELTKAREKLREGRLQMLVRIPPGYENSRTVYIETFNINTDMMKNARLRLEHAILDELNKNGELKVVPHLITEKPKDVWRAAYISGSSLLLALFFGATITAANLFAFDRENRTRKEILLTPINLTALGLGIILTSVLMAVLASLPTLLLALGMFHFKIYPIRLVMVYLSILPILVGCAGVGIMAAHFLKNYRVIQPVIIVSSIATFFGTGGFAGVNVLPPGAQIFAAVWPFSRIFSWFNPILHNFESGLSAVQYIMVALTGIIGLLLVIFAYRRELVSSDITHGQ